MEIDEKVKEYMWNRKIIDSQKYEVEKDKFSGVDDELKEVYECLDFVGRNKTPGTYSLPQSVHF